MDITNVAHTTTTTTSQNSLNPLLDFTTLFTSYTGISIPPLSTYILTCLVVNNVTKVGLTRVGPNCKVIQPL